MASPAGRPSTTATRPGPWDSPAVVKRRVATTTKATCRSRGWRSEFLQAERLEGARDRPKARAAVATRGSALAPRGRGLLRAGRALDVDGAKLERVVGDRTAGVDRFD